MSRGVPGNQCTVLFRAFPAGLQFSVEEKRRLKAFASILAARIGKGRCFTCVITRDEELRRLNRCFLGHDSATDVLSFPALDADALLGEIAISIDRAEAQARAFGHTRTDEVGILMLHGLLHLTGMDHECDDGDMAEAELKWRAELDLPRTLIARAESALTGRSPAQ